MKTVISILEVHSDSQYPVDIQTLIHDTPEIAPTVKKLYRSHTRAWGYFGTI